ncbi:MAG: inositol monophosphatase family protein [Alphaproteobacteria bacterium]
MAPDIDMVAALLREVAATEVMPRFQKLAAHEITEKKPGDIVTAADLGVERVLTQRLPDMVPGSRVVGEEAVHADPAVLKRISEDAPVWIVDPVDGTTNFSEGSPLFAVQLAYVVRGETCAAWVYDPVRDVMAMAEKGAGALLNGARAYVTPAIPVEDMKGALYAGPTRPGLTADFAAKKKFYAGGGYRRCVGQEYLSLVGAEMHFALFTRILPWDHAAGQHIHAEAGGYSKLVDGRPYSATESEGYILLAPDAESWATLRALFIA